MKRLLCVLLVLCASPVWADDGRLPPKVERSIRRAIQSGIGPIGNLQGRVDSNNALVVIAAAAGSVGAATAPIANLPGKVDASNNLSVTLAAGSVIPAPGSTTQVIFNDASVLAGDAGMTYNKTTDTLTLATSVVSGNGSAATPAFKTRDSGIFSPFAGYLGFSCGGGNCGEMASDGWHVPLAGVLNWAASGAASDVQLARTAANQLSITSDGATTNTADLGASAVRVRTGYFGTSVVSTVYQGSGTGTSVANVGANSCGTSAATIAGNQVSGVITVGATAGTQCRVTFSTAAPVARDCTVTDSTTTIATRATVVDTTNTDFLGAFVAGDKITFICMVR